MDLLVISKNALGTALAQGYTIDLESDGNGTVKKPDGTQYTIEGFKCDCPASTYGQKKPCKHVLWASQVYICPECGKWAVMVKVIMPTGQEFREFRCPEKHIYSFEDVQTIRRAT
tara:strand:- start:1750 stop:2094 length:345 start_codon:yes stop_codon:yes gene_type:complete